jgi:hypothetical protein
MAYEAKDGDISIFKNEKTKDSQPDYTGSVIINGKKMKVALWIKEGQKGKFFAGRVDDFQPKQQETFVPDAPQDGLPF